MTIGWYFIRSRMPVEGLPRWQIAFWNGARWYEPGKVEDSTMHMWMIGPQIPTPIDFNEGF